MPGRQVVEVVQQQQHTKTKSTKTRFCAGAYGITEAPGPGADEESRRTVIVKGE